MGNPKGRNIGGMQTRTSTARKPATRGHDDVQDAQVIELVQPVDEPAEPEKLRPLDEVLSELGGVDGGHVQVRQIDPRGGPAVFMGSYRPEEVTGEMSLLMQIQQDYGGGEYLIHVRDGSGFRANRRVKVGEKRSAAAAPDAGASTMVAAAIDRMQGQFGQLLQALVQRPQVSEADAEEKVLARMKVMADILGQRGGGVEAGDVMETLTRGIELGKQLGSAGGGDNTGTVMLESLRAFTAMLAQQPQPTRRPVPAQRQVAAPAQAVPAAQAPAAEDDRVTAMRTLLRVVLGGAAQGSDPELYAHLVADQLGEDGVSELLQFPDPVAMLVQLEPAAGAHQAWLGELAQELRNLQEGADDGANAKRVDGHPGRTGRGDTHPGPDAGPGA